MGYIKSLICKTLTVRGVSKIGNSKDRFLRCIWVIFVLSMTCLLLYSTWKMVQDFLNYDLILRYTIKYNDSSNKFPSFTFCQHNPFGDQADKYWENESIMSPTKFNNKLREKMQSSINSFENLLSDLFLFDDKATYYQHLLLNETDKLSWGNETIIICRVFNGSKTRFRLGSQCAFQVKKISIPQFFNCFTVTPHDTVYGRRVISIAILVRLSRSGKRENRKSFVSGLLNQLSGIKGLIHEPFTFPDIENEGFHLEPGKLFEIKFDIIRKTKVPTPKQPCASEARDKIIDLNESYLYSQEACLNSIKGLFILNQCSCFHADTMRSETPNTTHPYCGNILNTDFNSLDKRLTCIQKSIIEFENLVEKLSTNQCMPCCERFDYDASLSFTDWLPTDWQLGWLMNISQAEENLFLSRQGTNSVNSVWRTNYENYINSSNLFNYPKYIESLNESNFVMIVIKRKNFDTIEQREKLDLDLYELISRFGGLCSLCLGLTCAFVMEVIEVVYLGYIESKISNKMEQNISPYEVQIK